MASLVQTIEDFYGLLAAGQTEDLAALFETEPAINTPMQGAVKGKTALTGFVAEQQKWLESYQARAQLTALTQTSERIVAEYVLYLHLNDKNIELPLSIVFDRQGEKVTSIRVYHSTWPLTGQHIVRSPLLEAATGLHEPLIVEQYMHALASGDETAILATFEDDGYVREPSGPSYKHGGPAGRKAFYDVVLADVGVSLKHCSATFDGQRLAVEYICDEWGKAKFAPQAGMAVYEIGQTGRILAVRIHDDVSPPSE